MPSPSFFTQIFARDPRKTVRFPNLPIDAALAEWPAILASVNVPPPEKDPAAPSSGQIVALATHLWRARAKLVASQAVQPTEDSRRTLRHLDSSLEAMATMGVVIRDHLQEVYDAGMPVNVITFQPVEGVARDTIVETIRPSVFWHERLLQSAEVVVGTPDRPAGTTLPS